MLVKGATGKQWLVSICWGNYLVTSGNKQLSDTVYGVTRPQWANIQYFQHAGVGYDHLLVYWRRSLNLLYHGIIYKHVLLNFVRNLDSKKQFLPTIVNILANDTLCVTTPMNKCKLKNGWTKYWAVVGHCKILTLESYYFTVSCAYPKRYS